LNIAEQSMPRRVLKEDIRAANDTLQGRPKTTTYQPAKLTNWMNPFLWDSIEKAEKRAGYQMHLAAIVKELQRIDGKIFHKLAPQTVGAWIDQTGDRPRWSSVTLERVKHGNAPGGLTTCVGVLVCYC
jgi:hypothetical protein